VFLASSKGQSIRFKESDIRDMGRTAGGVRGIKLGAGDRLIEADIIHKKDKEETSILVMGENGYGKKTSAKEYKTQKRGGGGIKTFKVTPKTGSVIAARAITPMHTEMVAMSKKSQVIRIEIKEAPLLGRQTQGVRIMKLRAGDKIASLICL